MYIFSDLRKEEVNINETQFTVKRIIMKRWNVKRQNIGIQFK